VLVGHLVFAVVVIAIGCSVASFVGVLLLVVLCMFSLSVFVVLF